MSKTLAALVVGVMLLVSSGVAQATTSGVASSIVLGGETPPNGSVICESDQGFKLCDEAYSPQLYGVVVSNPGVALVSSSSANRQPVVNAGTTQVRISSSNGIITKGDYITSSSVPGVAQKADRSGYALGIAQSSWTNEDPEAIGLVSISVAPKPAIMTNRAEANLIQLIRDGIDATYLSPVLTLRYMLATLITVSSVVLAFWFFARVAHSGVQAIGRNPLAGKTIQLGILLNVIITLGVMGTGLFLAYLLLVW